MHNLVTESSAAVLAVICGGCLPMMPVTPGAVGLLDTYPKGHEIGVAPVATTVAVPPCRLPIATPWSCRGRRSRGLTAWWRNRMRGLDLVTRVGLVDWLTLDMAGHRVIVAGERLRIGGHIAVNPLSHVAVGAVAAVRPAGPMWLYAAPTVGVRSLIYDQPAIARLALGVAVHVATGGGRAINAYAELVSAPTFYVTPNCGWATYTAVAGGAWACAAKEEAKRPRKRRRRAPGPPSWEWRPSP